MTPADPCMTFDPISALHVSQGFFIPNLVGIWHSIDSILTPSWPGLYDLWPANELHFDQGFLQPNVVTIGHSWTIWPLVDPADSCMTFDLINASHFDQGFFLQNLVAIGRLKSTWPLDDLCHLLGSLLKFAHKLWGPVLYPHAEFQPDTSKHNETHFRTNTCMHTYRFCYLYSTVKK